jgi:hypothetical protein
MMASIIGALNKTRGTPLGTAIVASDPHPWPASGYRIDLWIDLSASEPKSRSNDRPRVESCVETLRARPALSQRSRLEGKKSLLRGHDMVLKERIHALADGARAGRTSDDMPAQGEDDPAKRAVIHEWENWAALNSDDLQSPNVMIFFLDHLQSKKAVLLNFDCEDKYQRIRDWLVREGRLADSPSSG